MSRWGLALIAALLASLLPTASAQADFDITGFDGQVLDAVGDAYTQAAGHPYAVSTQIEFSSRIHPQFNDLWPAEPVKTIAVNPPPGLIGNPVGIAKCTGEQLAPHPNDFVGTLCPAESQVGVANITVALGAGSPFPPTIVSSALPVFNMVAPPQVPARFALNFAGTIVALDAEVRSGPEYGLSVNVRNVSEGLPILGTSLTLWGVPADASHDAERFCPNSNDPGCPSTAALKPFLRMPTACPAPGQGLLTSVQADSWFTPGVFKSASFISHLPPGYPQDPDPSTWGPPQGPTGCEQVPFQPSFAAKPAASPPAEPLVAGATSGYSFDLSMSQEDDLETGIGPADLKKAVVTLPEGVRVSPSAAFGLAACSPAEIALTSNAAPACPEASKVGSVTIDTPLLEEQMQGSVYLATPKDNPSNTLLALYIVAKGPGVVIKLPGRVDADPSTGQLTATFDNNPQLPFSHLHLAMNSGPRAQLVNPPRCGTYTTHAVLSSWSGKTVSSESSFTLSRDGKGASCPPARFSPEFEAGVVNPIAGADSPFLLTVSRSDEDEELEGLSVEMPPGLLARIANVELCASAQAGQGACPATSLIGTVTAAAGPGPNPFYVNNGRAYLTEGYKGAPFGLAVVVPAVAGPFDLGNVVVRAAVQVDPRTAQVRVVADPMPTVLEGIRLQVRVVHVAIDRPDFILNPTSCDEMGVNGIATSTAGTNAALHARFQVADCAALPFKPKLSFKLKGATKRGGYPALRAVLKMPEGSANIARTEVALPHSEFLAQSHIGTVCTRVQYAADACPARSIYGHARAFSPLLDQPLEGPVYLRSSSNPLPDLVAALHGQIDIDLVGQIDSKNSGIRTTFATVPDAPVSKFVLTMAGGKKGLLENSRNLCRSTNRATVRMDAHSGKVRETRPALRAECGKHGGGGGHR